MKKILAAFPALASVAVMIACSGSKTPATTAEGSSAIAGEAPATTILVAYFSARGHTRLLAEKIAEATGGRLYAIEAADPYTEADLDGWNDSARGTRESKDRSTRPAVGGKVDNFELYDTIYLGFPIWWYTAPTIVNTFLEQYDTDGKVIIPFATSGGSEFGATEADLRVSVPKAIFKPGRVLNDATQEQVDQWVESVSRP